MSMLSFHVDVTDRSACRVLVYPKHASIPSTYKKYCKAYGFLTGECGAKALIRVFLTIAARTQLYCAQGEVLNEADDTPYDDVDYMAIHNFAAHNVHPVIVRPTFKSSLNTVVPFLRAVFLDMLVRLWQRQAGGFYKIPMCMCSNLGGYITHSAECIARRHPRMLEDQPTHWAGLSFVAAALERPFTAAAKALYQMQENKIRPDVPTRDILCAIAQEFSQSGIQKSDPPVFDYFTAVQNSETRSVKSAGYMNVRKHVDEFASLVVKWSNTATQSKSWHYVSMQIDQIAKRIATKRQNVAYDPRWFPKLAAKIAVKAEVREAGSDESKVRVFFILSMIKLTVDKILYGDIFYRFYGKGMCGIGHKWAHGGAERIAQLMCAYDPDTSFFQTDVTKLDQSLMPGLLTLLFSLPASYYKGDCPEQFAMMRRFMTWSADETACTLVKWTGEDYRIVVGVMFSGLYGTSWGDTIYVAVVVRTFRYFLVRLLQESNNNDLLAKFRNHPNPIQIYGDNILMSGHKDIISFITKKTPTATFGLFEMFLQQKWGMKIKHDETGVFSSFFTTIRTTRLPGGLPIQTSVVYQGPIYLKRSFLKIKSRSSKGGYYAMPFRNTRDYYTKSITTAHTDTNEFTWIGRWVGLIVDTAGTNPTAYAYLRFLITNFFRQRSMSEPVWNDMVNQYLFADNPDIQKIMKRNGLTSDTAVSMNSRRALFLKFCPTEQVDLIVAGLNEEYFD